jgi:2-amino-5-formylamino-6-ribosylaminopyrimidin-4(3H)-one 5'-monophosphate deformylase
MGNVLGICDEEKISEHQNFHRNPEVAMIGLKLARKNNDIIDKEARHIEKEGMTIDEEFGKRLLDDAYDSVIEDIKKLLKKEDD